MNHISILTKNNSNYAKDLCLYLSKYNKTIIINDEKSCSDKYSIDKEFYGLAKFTAIGIMPKLTCSWDKAFLNIYENNLKCNYFYFIEDDVYCKNLEIFKNLIKTLNKFDEDLVSAYVRNKNEAEDWPMWELLQIESKVFEEKHLCKSINPFCRISKRLIDKILEFKFKYRNFIFHELLFTSLCKENNFSFLDLIENEKTKKYFGIYQVDRFLDTIQENKINHPVKRHRNQIKFFN